ncbi:legumain-like [Argonauta hians]
MMVNTLCTVLVILMTTGYGLALHINLPQLDNGGVHWALLVAGSNSWYNYRHQSDVCHAYQVLHKNGIPDERIVVMMFDDIANNRKNPTPGKIVNHPNGTDVYEGVPKDYIGFDVTPKTFLNVLQGKKAELNGRGSGKVIASGPNDNVFVYFADHGAPGIIAFPEEYLHASQLHSAIMNMHTQKKYKEMVFYIEACESGSMFPGLPKDINVFATTAANDKESSYACYFDKDRETYLGDVYSVCWLENSDKVSLSSESLQQQFKIVKKETNTSHVQEFGDMAMRNMKLSAFQGDKPSGNGLVMTEDQVEATQQRFNPSNSVDAREVKLSILQHRVQLAKTPEEKEEAIKELEEEYSIRSKVEETFHQIVKGASADVEQMSKIFFTTHQPLFTSCYEEAVDHLHDSCLEFQNHEFVLARLRLLHNLCMENIPIETITTSIDKVCGRRHFY